MFVVDNYALAVAFCVVTMFCWGSWANTQKLAGKTWRFELFYWDYVFGVMLMALVFAFTLGSMGASGRSFLADVQQADAGNLGMALLGGVVFNAANIMLVAAIAIAGMSVAFPVGIGLALIVGVVVNYVAQPAGNPWLLSLGVAMVTVAIVIDALAYRKLPGQGGAASVKGLVLSVACGLLMGTFYLCVARAMSANPVELEAGKLSPYSAMVFFSLGVLLSNFVLNTIIMAKPFVGAPVPIGNYFKGTFGDHLWGIVGGMIWGVGMMLSIIAAGKAGFAISYGLGQGATMIAAFWGVFIWREFREAPKSVTPLLAVMFLAFLLGLTLLIVAKLPQFGG